jgi:hypothetical protein
MVGLEIFPSIPMRPLAGTRRKKRFKDQSHERIKIRWCRAD